MLVSLSEAPTLGMKILLGPLTSFYELKKEASNAFAM